jgi:hypothetical protein
MWVRQPDFGFREAVQHRLSALAKVGGFGGIQKKRSNQISTDWGM